MCPEGPASRPSLGFGVDLGVWKRALVPGKQWPCGVQSASVDPKIETLNRCASTVLVGYVGQIAAGRSPWLGAGALCQWSRSQEDGAMRTRDLQLSGSCIRRSGCGDLRWATEGLNFSEERFGGVAPRGAADVNLG